jgi:hypothetical protein
MQNQKVWLPCEREGWRLATVITVHAARLTVRLDDRSVRSLAAYYPVVLELCSG